MTKMNTKPKILSLPLLLKVGDVARILRLHPNTVRKLSNNGKLKSYRIGSRGDRRFKPEDINQFLNRRQEWLTRQPLMSLYD